MPTYISLLRGINVSGKNIIKMADFKTRLSSLGFQNVQTYIQSGNIVFDAPTTKVSTLEERISSLIHDVYGFDVPVMVFNSSVWKTVWESNPWLNDPEKDLAYMHVTFLGDKPSGEAINLLAEVEAGKEEFQLMNHWLYLYMPDGYGRAKLTNGFIEKKLKIRATTRNWKTVGKLFGMLAAVS